MRSILRGLATLSTVVALAACSGTSATSAPAATSAPPPAATSAGAPCADSTGATTVEATVVDFKWSQPINAKVGDVITWTNNDAAGHKVGLDDGSCAMSATIAGGGGKQSLVFSVAGTFAFHCTIHPSMKGTLTIS